MRRDRPSPSARRCRSSAGTGCVLEAAGALPPVNVYASAPPAHRPRMSRTVVACATRVLVARPVGLERLEPLGARVRLAEDADAEQRDEHQEGGDREERCEQLCPQLRRDPRDRADERVVGAREQPPDEPGGRRPVDPWYELGQRQCLSGLSIATDSSWLQSDRGRDQLCEQPLAVDLPDVVVAADGKDDLARVGVDVVALEVKGAPDCRSLSRESCRQACPRPSDSGAGREPRGRTPSGLPLSLHRSRRCSAASRSAP